jgi:Cu/Ag efflux protein CusF
VIVRDLTSAVLLGISLASCCAQTQNSKQPEPATIGDVFLLDSSSQKLTPLPREPWKAIGKPGWTTGTGAIQIAGETSSLRIKTGDKTELVFNVGNPESVRLYPLTRKKEKREFELVKVKSGFHPQRKILDGIAADISKFGDSSYKLVPQSPLGAGEYVIDVSGKMFTFGIDP